MHIMKQIKNSIKLFIAVFLLVGSGSAIAEKMVVEIRIKDHLFFPSELEVPAGKKIRLVVNNLDPTPEEFESYELNREKVIAGNSKAVIFIGPLESGVYPFFGEFYPKTAQGKIIVK